MSTTDAPPTEPPFLGESRIRLVDGLLAVLDQAEAQGEARWVSLEAPSGWGKTRVAQALYARLAARRQAGATPGADGTGPGRYWPATILEATDATPGDVASRRKRVFPDPTRFHRDPGALPGFFWWGIACEQRSCGTASQSLLEDLQQVEAHAIYLDAAWARLAPLAERLTPSRARLGQAGGDLGDELAGHGVGMALEWAASAGIPGGGLLVKLARLGVGKAAETRRHREILAAPGPLSGDPRPDPVDETLAMLTRLARPGLPVIVFVEDLHRATLLVEELIERLVRSNAALLVVTSTWPGELERRERLMTLAAEPIIAPRCLRVRHDQPAPPPFPAGAGLDALAPADLAELVRAYHPRTDPETLAQLANRFNNPLPLELICTLPKYRRASAQDGALRLDPADIERLPRRIEDIYRELWDELSEPAQQALALATLAIPDGDAAWHRAIAAQSVAGCLELADHDALAETLKQDRIPHGWVRALTDWLRRFNEPDQLTIAAAARDEHFLEEDLGRVLDRLAAALAAHPLADPDPETQHCARLLLTLHRRGEGAGPGRIADTDALRAVRLLQRAFADQPRELPARVALGQALAGLRVDADAADMLAARADHAQALGESGQVDAAETAYTVLLADQGHIVGPDHPDTLTIRHNIASLRAQSGEIAAALADFAPLLADRVRILGPDHLETLGTRNNIAGWRAESGEIAAARAEFAALLADQGRILGPEHPHTFRTRNNIASLRAQSGEIAAALSDFAAILVDQARILGADHPDTLITRSNIASWRAESGEIAVALADFAALLVDQRRILGPDHPHALQTRNDIASLRAQSGEIAAALADFAALLADQMRVLSPDHPATLITRHNIGDARGKPQTRATRACAYPTPNAPWWTSTNSGITA